MQETLAVVALGIVMVGTLFDFIKLFSEEKPKSRKIECTVCRKDKVA